MKIFLLIKESMKIFSIVIQYIYILVIESESLLFEEEFN